MLDEALAAAVSRVKAFQGTVNHSLTVSTLLPVAVQKLTAQSKEGVERGTGGGKRVHLPRTY